jgi:hypothetical protein
LLAEVERWAAQNGGKLPGRVVVSLGGQDVHGQTPLDVFERALDVLIDRLRLHGVSEIVFLSLLPEPGRAAHAKPYREKVESIAGMHKLRTVDPLTRWEPGAAWEARFRWPGSTDGADVYLPVPNQVTLGETGGWLAELWKP